MTDHFSACMRDVIIKYGGITRKWDEFVPYSTHAVWGAVTILSEKNLSETFRHQAAIAFLYHDIPEDTLYGIDDLPEKVRDLVTDMTFSGGFEQERKVLFSRPKEAILLKLYDKVSNLMDGHWMDEDKARIYWQHTADILAYVQENFPPLMICDIAGAVLSAKVRGL